MSPVRPAPAAGAQLSERELGIAYLVTEGMTNLEIAEKVHLSAATVKTHLWRISVKTGARNRAHLAAIFSSDGRCRSAPDILAMMHRRLNRLERYEPKPGTVQFFQREAQLTLLGQLIRQVEQFQGEHG